MWVFISNMNTNPNSEGWVTVYTHTCTRKGELLCIHIRQDDERRHSDLYSRVNLVIYRKLVILRTLDSCRVTERRKKDCETTKPRSQSGRLWVKSRQTTLRTKAPSEHSFQKEVRTSVEEREPWGLTESSRQAERHRQDRRSVDTVGGPTVIDVPQGKDSIDKTTRTVNDTIQEVDDRWYASVL
jgi:hypothetical protein